MKPQSVYRVNSPQVIFENIDGELILVHMEKGAYYTTDDIGSMVWFLVEARCSVAEMCESLQFQFEAGPGEIEAAVHSFLERLLAEDLIAPDQAAEPRTPAARVATTPKRPFRTPALQSYRDMQDMLALDPIHDVEAAGWPVPKPDDDSVTSQSA